MAVSKKQVEALGRFLIGDRPSGNGEWYMLCPLHKDKTRSASLNMETGQWYCHACAIGGTVKQLLDEDFSDGDAFVIPEETERDDISYGEVAGYHSALMDNNKVRRKLLRRRGLEQGVLDDNLIGWDGWQHAYTIPIFDSDGSVKNIRRYQLDPDDDRRKIWSVEGHGQPDLYPIDQLDNQTIVICEGEWDALATIQAGFPAITRTGAAKVWKDKWNVLFRGKDVIVCHDSDKAGKAGNRLVSRALSESAASVRVVELPYKMTEKHGKDLSDYWDDYEASDFAELVAATPPIATDDEVGDAIEITINDSTTDNLVGKRVKMRATVDGKSREDFIIPKNVQFSCSMNFGQKCELCPMNELDGEMSYEVLRNDTRVLRLTNTTEDQVHTELFTMSGIVPSCKVCQVTITSSRNVADFNIRPDVDLFNEERSTHASRNITVIDSGEGAALLNTTVEIEGVIVPHPRNQQNVFLVDDIRKVETSIDLFKMTDEVESRLQKFRVEDGQSPIDKLREIAADMSQNVTRIYHRDSMHMFVDLVFHSVISWNFNGKLEAKGWIDALILGDSRTGKSETADELRKHYRVGQMTTGENASFAGLVGGAKQVFGNKWEISWGIIPLNDRRMLIMDELSSMPVEDIARMSSLRSSGIASVDKIEGGSTRARTRLLWLSNPREGHRVSYYHRALEAVNILIHSREDVARLDMAMSVASEDVDPKDINVMTEPGTPTFDSQSCNDLLGWVWSRKADQVRWEEGVENYIVTKLALKMGKRYSEDPTPLVQAANVRMKIARVAVALAARTFSHVEGDPEVIYVTKEHALGAAKFLDEIYSNKGFGYLSASRDQARRAKSAYKNRSKVENLMSDRQLLEFFQTRISTFGVRDMEEYMAGLGVDAVNAMIGDLRGWGMLERTASAWRVSDQFRKILRELEQ